MSTRINKDNFPELAMRSFKLTVLVFFNFFSFNSKKLTLNKIFFSVKKNYLGFEETIMQKTNQILTFMGGWTN